MENLALAAVLETLMLLGFAAAWPFSIFRAYRARTAKGTSLVFMITVESAYVCGMLSKIVSDSVTYVFAFYLIDFSLVACALAVYARNRAIDRSGGNDRTLRDIFYNVSALPTRWKTLRS